MSLSLVLFVAGALGHPAGTANPADPNGGMPGQRLEVSVAPDGIRVNYFVELAALRMYKDAKAEGATGPEWAARKVESLRPGVRIRWNDEDLALAPVVVGEPAQLKESAFVELHLAAEAPLPETSGELELRMDNFPDEACFYAASVQVDGALVVTESNLGRVVEGRLRDNQHGAWRRDDAARVTELTIRPTRVWEGRLSGPLPERMEGLLPWRISYPKAGLTLLCVVGGALIARLKRGR